MDLTLLRGLKLLCFAVCCAAAWICFSVGTAAAQITDDESRADATDTTSAYYRLKRDDTLQFELPEAVPPSPPSPWLQWLANILEPIFSVIAWLATPVFWLGVGAIIATALYFIIKTLVEQHSWAKRAKEEKQEVVIPLYQPSQARARVLLEEVDRLAAEGRYGEAVHTLLFKSIQDISDARPNAVRRSLTSREIGKLSVLSDAARSAFSSIAGLSERAHFGGSEIDASGFQDARAAYAGMAGLTATTPS